MKNENGSQKWKQIFDKANLLANSGKHHEALDLYEMAVKIDSSHYMTWNNIGVAKLCLGSYEDSLADFSRAIDLNSKYKDAYEDLSRAIELDRSYWSAYRHRSIINQMLGNHEESYKDFLTSKTLDKRPK